MLTWGAFEVWHFDVERKQPPTGAPVAEVRHGRFLTTAEPEMPQEAVEREA
jgi:hypothetical protein